MVGYEFWESVDSKFIPMYKSYKVLIGGFLLPSTKQNGRMAVLAVQMSWPNDFAIYSFNSLCISDDFSAKCLQVIPSSLWFGWLWPVSGSRLAYFFWGGMVSHTKYRCFSSHPRSPLKASLVTGQVLNKLANRWPSFKVLLKAFSKKNRWMWWQVLGWNGCDGEGVAVVIFGLIFVSRIGRQLWAKRCCDMLV